MPGAGSQTRRHVPVSIATMLGRQCPPVETLPDGARVEVLDVAPRRTSRGSPSARQRRRAWPPLNASMRLFGVVSRGLPRWQRWAGNRPTT